MVDLKWVIEKNWIGEYKWLYSEREGYDIGTPATVDIMLIRRNQLKISGDDRFKYPDMGLINLEETNRERLIEAYLLEQEIHDNDGANQLEGEVRRWGARRFQIPTSEVELTLGLIDDWVRENKLKDILGIRIRIKLLDMIIDRELYKENISK